MLENEIAKLMKINQKHSNLGSISSAFYKQLLRAQIPKAQKTRIDDLIDCLFAL